MGEISAESLELAPSDKIATKLGSVASEMLDVRDVHGVRLRSVSSRDSLNIRKPSAQETSKITVIACPAARLCSVNFFEPKR